MPLLLVPHLGLNVVVMLQLLSINRCRTRLYVGPSLNHRRPAVA